MQIYPAVDLKDGKCVRLIQGDFSRVTVFNDDPVQAAMEWVNAGATYIHVIDLDGARSGTAHNDAAIADIVAESGLPVQVGGGIRRMKDIEDKLKIGVSRVIIGTSAINNEEFVKEVVRNFGDKVAVGIDANNGMVAIKGWEEISSVSATDLCMQMVSLGVKTFIYTDISKDGMMRGPNIQATKEIIEIAGYNVIASGGVSTMDDIEELKKIGASGVIIGKALYQKALNLREVIDKFERK